MVQLEYRAGSWRRHPAHRCVVMPSLGHRSRTAQIGGAQRHLGWPPRNLAARDQQSLRELSPYDLEIVEHANDRPLFRMPTLNYIDEIERGARIDGIERLVEQNWTRVGQQHTREQH